MDGIKIRKDANGNIINKSNKNYHISFYTNVATIIEVESYKRYNILIDSYNDDEDDDDVENEEKNSVPFIDTYVERKVEDVPNKDPHGNSHIKCLII